MAPERSLALKRPELLAELHPTRNRALDPYAIGYGSQRKLWWRCPDCGHEWTATVASRAIKDSGCRRCFMNRHRQQLAQRNRERPPQIPTERSIAVKRPELLAELHPTLNGDLDPYAIGASSHRRLWWRCSSGHEWQTTVNTRSRGCGCPACASEQSARPRASVRDRPETDDQRGSLSEEECIAALTEFIQIFGELPTDATYREFATGSDRRLPTPAEIRSACNAIGGWRGAVRQASTHH